MYNGNLNDILHESFVHESFAGLVAREIDVFY